MARRSWSVGPASSRPLRLLWYASIAVWAGFGLLALGIAVAVAGAGLLAGELGPALLVGLLVLVGGPLSALYLWPMLRDPAQRPAFLTPGPWVQARWVALGAIAVAAAVVLDPRAAVVAFFGGLAAGFLGALLRSEGELDPAKGELTLHGRTVDLRTVAGVARVDMGDLAVCWLRYRRRPGTTMAPRFVVCPRPAADRLADVVRTSGPQPEERSERRSNPLVRAVFAAFGLGTLALGVGLHLLDAVPAFVALWGTAVLGLFSALFLWLAYAEG